MPPIFITKYNDTINAVLGTNLGIFMIIVIIIIIIITCHGNIKRIMWREVA